MPGIKVNSVHGLLRVTVIVGLSVVLALAVVSPGVKAETPANETSANETSADDDAEYPSFTINPVDSTRGYVEIDAEPGQRYALNFDVKNLGNGAGVALLYAADAITLANGGLGARGFDAERTGPTTWLDFESREIELEPDDHLIQTVPIQVPDDVEPGEHLTSVVIQNRDPIATTEEGSGIQFDRVNRQVAAILIRIPGPTEPGLEIGEAEHRMAGQNSTAWIEVSNPGNVMVRPDEGEFRLEDDNGFEMLRQDASMMVIYAGHETHFAINLGERLEPGDYWVWLYLEDEARGVSASGERLLLHVPELPAPESEEDSGLTGLIQPPRMPGDDGSGSWWTLLTIVAAASLLAALIGALLGRRRRGAAPEGVMAAAPIESEPEADGSHAAQPSVAEAPEPTPQMPLQSELEANSGRIKPLRPSKQSD